MSARRAVIAAAMAAVALTGCAQTTDGKAYPSGGAPTNTADAYVPQGDKPGRQFRNLLTECDTVTDEEITKAVGGDDIQRIFFGAICRWDVTGPSGSIKVTFNWFEDGSLEVERTTLDKLHYIVTETNVEGRRALKEQRPNDPDSCGVTAGAPDSGIIGWWVQYVPGFPHGDPCDAATKLIELSLNLAR